MAPLLKLPKNVGDLGKFIVAKGFKKLPKVQKIANSGHTGVGVEGTHDDHKIPRPTIIKISFAGDNDGPRLKNDIIHR